MGFLKTLSIGAIGYVLGARAGRGRYEQIKSNAQKVWSSILYTVSQSLKKWMPKTEAGAGEQRHGQAPEALH